MENNKKVISIKGKDIGGNHPIICTPLVGKNEQELDKELNDIIVKDPDVIEWRVDFFQKLEDTQKVLDTLSSINHATADIPLLITIRTEHEGGQRIDLREKEKLTLLECLCSTGYVDLVDYELSNADKNIKYLREVTKKYNVKMIMSYHNFKMTPNKEVFFELCKKAEQNQADIVKISAMPNNMGDVLLLLESTRAVNSHIKMPVVTMSMGGYGSITRMFGWLFGSAMTFAVGDKSSAPGQIPVEDLRTIINIIEKSV